MRTQWEVGNRVSVGSTAQLNGNLRSRHRSGSTQHSRHATATAWTRSPERCGGVATHPPRDRTDCEPCKPFTVSNRQTDARQAQVIMNAQHCRLWFGWHSQSPSPSLGLRMSIEVSGCALRLQTSLARLSECPSSSASSLVASPAPPPKVRSGLNSRTSLSPASAAALWQPTAWTALSDQPLTLHYIQLLPCGRQLSKRGAEIQTPDLNSNT